MTSTPTVLITGASGNLGSKLRQHLEGRYSLRLVDRDARGDPNFVETDLSCWHSDRVALFRGCDVVVHLAADATAQQAWPALIAPNIDCAVNVFQTAALAGISRVVYASSNHVMGGYKDLASPVRLGTDVEPRPGTDYVVQGEHRNSHAYGATKLFGERLGKCFADTYGRTVIAVRIGWVRPGGNRAEDIPRDREDWFRLMWLSDRDYCQIMERCIVADVPAGFHIINAMSANTGMRWDLTTARQLVGFQPIDDITRS